MQPRNEAWERLQARMQEAQQQETPNPFLVPAAAEQKEERGTVRMWYYSAAAAVTMVLSVGLWVNRDNIDPLQPSGTVANVQQHQQAPTARTAPSSTGAPAGSTEEVITQGTQKNGANNEANFPASTAASKSIEPNQALASVPSKAAPEAFKESATTTSLSKKEENLAVQPKEAQPTQEPALMAATTPVKAQEAAKNSSAPASLEIIVKLDDAQATTSLAHASTKETNLPQEEDQPESGRVLKGILKQVKNLRDGEKVKLSDLGITKHTYALETIIGNKKISKTIEL